MTVKLYKAIAIIPRYSTYVAIDGTVPYYLTYGNEWHEARVMYHREVRETVVENYELVEEVNSLTEALAIVKMERLL